MATLEQRVEKLENFMGNIDKVKTIYANTVEEICNRWLNVLYIESTPLKGANVLNIKGFLSDLTGDDPIPHNSIFFIQPSHNFAYNGSDHTSVVDFERDGETIRLPLKKWDPAHPGNTIYLEPGDYLTGNTYLVYVDSQDDCIISASDAGATALQLVEALQSDVATLQSTVTAINNALSGTIEPNVIAVNNLTVSQSLTLTGCPAFELPAGCTITGTPTNGNDITNKTYVDAAISDAIAVYHNTYHLFGTTDPSSALANAPEKAIYYKYSNG